MVALKRGFDYLHLIKLCQPVARQCHGGGTGALARRNFSVSIPLGLGGLLNISEPLIPHNSRHQKASGEELRRGDVGYPCQIIRYPSRQKVASDKSYENLGDNETKHPEGGTLGACHCDGCHKRHVADSKLKLKWQD